MRSIKYVKKSKKDVSPFEIKYGVFILSDGEIFHHREFHSKAEMKYYGDSQQEKFIEACWVDIG